MGFSPIYEKIKTGIEGREKIYNVLDIDRLFWKYKREPTTGLLVVVLDEEGKLGTPVYGTPVSVEEKNVFAVQPFEGYPIVKFEGILTWSTETRKDLGDLDMLYLPQVDKILSVPCISEVKYEAKEIKLPRRV